MSVVVRVHFDGKVIVPDEPVDLPVNRQLKAELSVVEPEAGRTAEREAAWQRLLSSRIPGLNMPDEALRRSDA